MHRASVLLFLSSALVLGAAFARAEFQLSSPEFEDGGMLTERHVFAGFGCSGDNQSPALAWSDPPEGTESFALLVHDPDAPIASGWWHWVLIDIPADTRALTANAGDPAAGLAPEGSRQIVTDFGVPGWGGPCPPEGREPHRYNFTLVALDTAQLEIPEGASTALVAFMVEGAKLGEARLTGLYQR
ncbi:MAG: YbhB/YbcL family Raf kinase inhibitor-like protein [Gammaproteobacteria bacterium]|nr:MAG: YbhB/YbcL family Raf kinase inhibitor-like protein [Gammaproteobacteria bacterium]